MLLTQQYPKTDVFLYLIIHSFNLISANCGKTVITDIQEKRTENREILTSQAIRPNKEDRLGKQTLIYNCFDDYINEFIKIYITATAN